jgi:tetratricopeptide (TPR) repeat protein
MLNLPNLERAHEAFKTHDFEDALKYYNLELKVDPQNITIMNNIGFIHYFTFNLKQAKEAFTKVVQLDEDDQIGWFGLFLVARRLKDAKLERICLYKVYQLGDLPFDMLLENIDSFLNN